MDVPEYTDVFGTVDEYEINRDTMLELQKYRYNKLADF